MWNWFPIGKIRRVLWNLDSNMVNEHGDRSNGLGDDDEERLEDIPLANYISNVDEGNGAR